MTGAPFTGLLIPVAIFLWVAIAVIAIAVTIASAALRRRGGDGMEDLIEATREETPDHVLDEWTREFGQ